jgi:hypothetical protein
MEAVALSNMHKAEDIEVVEYGSQSELVAQPTIWRLKSGVWILLETMTKKIAEYRIIASS